MCVYGSVHPRFGGCVDTSAYTVCLLAYAIRLAKHLVSLYHDDEAEASAASGLPRGSSGALGASGLGSTSTSSSGIPKPGGSRTGGPSGASGSSGASSAVAGGDAFLTSGVGAVPQVFLREYIAYAKRASCPGLSEQAGEALVQVKQPYN